MQSDYLMLFEKGGRNEDTSIELPFYYFNFLFRNTRFK